MRLNLRQKALSHPMLAKFAFNCWPPLWGTGIWVTHIQKDFKYISVNLNLNFYNRNYIGIHFGGNLFSMTDPFYTLMLFMNLGRHYFVCDKAASINFLSPGKGKVKAEFTLSEETLMTIKQKTATGDALCLPLSVDILDTKSGALIAKVTRELFIQHKA